jgi:hypothetical protein
LYAAAEEIVLNITARATLAGVQPKMPSDRALLLHAYQYAFAQEIRAKDQRQLQEKLAAQSKTRRPAATSRAPLARPPKKTGPQTQHDAIQEILANPDVIAAAEAVGL